MKTITWLRSLASRLVPAKRTLADLSHDIDLDWPVIWDEIREMRRGEDAGWAEVAGMLPGEAGEWQPPEGGDAA